jgi:hypothetical protein
MGQKKAPRGRVWRLIAELNLGCWWAIGSVRDKCWGDLHCTTSKERFIEFIANVVYLLSCPVYFFSPIQT